MKTYIIFKGRNPSFYSTRHECKINVHGFSGCVYCGFDTEDEASAAFNNFCKEKAECDKNSEILSWLSSDASGASSSSAYASLKYDLQTVTAQRDILLKLHDAAAFTYLVSVKLMLIKNAFS
ncbi:proton pump-interactor 1-like protein [Tanacetum coccineum]